MFAPKKIINFPDFGVFSVLQNGGICSVLPSKKICQKCLPNEKKATPKKLINFPDFGVFSVLQNGGFCSVLPSKKSAKIACLMKKKRHPKWQLYSYGIRKKPFSGIILISQ